MTNAIQHKEASAAKALRAWGALLLAALFVVTPAGPSAAQATRAAALDRLAAEAGALLVVGFHGTRPGEAQVRRLGDAIASGRVGGVVLFARNIRDREQVRALVGYLRGRSPTDRLIVMIDQEGGRVARLSPRNGFAARPSAQAVAALPSEEAASIFRAMAADLADIGATATLGPVVDLATEPDNRVIVGAGRSYGADPSIVSRFAGMFVAAHRAAGVAACLKHFPGHGASEGDTHDGPTHVGPLWRADVALAPYAALIGGATDVGCVMTSHLSAPQLTGRQDVAVTFSADAVAHLRVGLGFRGVVVTDDMLMGAATTGRRFADAAVAALAAGHDLILVSDWRSGGVDRSAQFQRAVRAALDAGALAPWAVEASLWRVRAWSP